MPTPEASWNAFDAASGFLKLPDALRGRMRLLALCVLLALAAPTAAAKADYVLEAMDGHAPPLAEGLGGGGYFRLAGGTEANPTLDARAGERLVILLRNEGGVPHDLAFALPGDARVPCCVAPGDQAVLMLDVPQDAPEEVAYFCTLHGNMKGVMRVAAAETPEPVAKQEVPGGGLLAAGLAVACAASLHSASRRRGVA